MKRIQTANKGKRKKSGGKTYLILFCTFYFLFLSLVPGCGNKFFDPTQIGRFRPTPAVNVILDSLGVAEEKPSAWVAAKEPQPEDLTAEKSDYTFRAGDVVRISIYELYQEGIEYVNDYVVTETGKISVPDVGVIQAAGLTETQLEEEIKKILSPSILKEPSVVVTLVGSQQRTFSIIGDGVTAPGRYVIPRYDFRLTDALATAGGARQFNVSYIYVTRYPGEEAKAVKPLELEMIEPELSPPGQLKELTQPQPLTEPTKSEREMLEIITPLAKHHWPKSKVVVASAELGTDKDITGAVRPDNLGPGAGRKSSTYDRKPPAPSPQLATPENKRQPVSIQDILKRLSERARREPVTEPGKVEVETVPKPLAEPIAPETFEEPIDVEKTLKMFPELPAPETIVEGPPAQKPAIKKPGVEKPAEVVKPPVVEPVAPGAPAEERQGRIEWIFKDGKWVPVQIGPPPQPQLPEVPPEKVIEGKPKPKEEVTIPPELLPPGFELEKKPASRVIKVPVDKLLAGDPRYNIIIKAGDTVNVPVDVIGEFCIMGNVNYQGYVNITGRPMTLKMAIAAAGGLGPLAWPQKCEVIRRIGEDKEEVVMVDLDKIASGEQPDFFIKPNDLINVGTHATSRWRAVLRNAFRATYGFGFIYDRNFADRDFYGSVWPF